MAGSVLRRARACSTNSRTCCPPITLGSCPRLGHAHSVVLGPSSKCHCCAGTSGDNRFGPDPLAEVETAPRPPRLRRKAGTSRARSNLSRPVLAHPAACMLSGAHDRCPLDCPRSHPLPLGNPGRCRRAGRARKALNGAGFTCHRVTFSEPGTADVDNLYARIGTTGRTSPSPATPTWCRRATRAPGASARSPARSTDGFLLRPRRRRHEGRHRLLGRRGARASRRQRRQAARDGKGSISFLITGDEEDVSVNGTIKLLKWAAERGEKFDHCVLGEPSNVETLGDTIKVGRRGSQSGTLYVDGVQGHVAYPHRAANPVPDISRLIVALMRRAARPWQRAVPGLQSRIHLGRRRQHRQQRHPGRGARKIQHPLQRLPHPGDRCATLVETRLTKACGNRIRARIDWEPSNSDVFVTKPGPFTDSRWSRGRGGDRPQAGAVDLRRHLGRALHLKLLPGDGVRPGRPDHAPDRRARAGRRIWRQLTKVYRGKSRQLFRLDRRYSLRSHGRTATGPAMTVAEQVATLNNPPAPDKARPAARPGRRRRGRGRRAPRRDRRRSSGRRRPSTSEPTIERTWLCRNERAEVMTVISSPVALTRRAGRASSPAIWPGIRWRGTW